MSVFDVVPGAQACRTVVDLFDLSVSRRGAHLAVAFGVTNLTYDDLDRYSNRVAHRLLTTGLPTGSCIGLCLDRSHHAIAAMLGVLKAGYAFVPLDPDFPQPRLQYMVQDATIACSITQQSLADRVNRLVGTALVIESDFDDADQSAPPTIVDADQLAYLMYTSGSTGKPKGVEITHAALANYCLADADIYQLTESDCTLQFSTLNFDIAIEEIFPPLITGSSIAVRPQQRSDDTNELSSLIRQYGVTAIHVATAYWHEWVNLLAASNEQTPESIRLMVVTGEKVSTEHYRRWLGMTSHTVLWANAYGPTEATVTATVFIPDVRWRGQNMPIGKPLPGYSAYILAEDLSPVDAGETGHLFIGGPSLARSYLNRPDLTAKAFLVAPWGERIYRTGDLARWLEDGNIEYAGRADHQIKVGSYRIEPGEIEEAANRHPVVNEAVVVAFEPEPGASKQIALYVGVGDDSAGPKSADAHQQIRSFLQEDLPPFMVPAVLTLLPALPKTINGKIDRDALPVPVPSVSTDQSSGSAEADNLATDTERRIAQIWREVLPGTRPGRRDNFFAIGGTSLSAVRFMSRVIQEFNASVPSRHLMTENLAQVAVRVRPDDRPAGNVMPVDPEVVKRTPAFFSSGTVELFGVIHEPVDQSTRGAIVICPSVGHEYLRSHRSLRVMADTFAQRGFSVLRFDYSGTGDSDGDLVDSTLLDWQRDIAAACAHIRNWTGVSAVSLLGLRVGGLLSLSMLVSPSGQATAGGIDRLMLWDPVPSGAAFLAQMRTLHAFELKNLDRFRWHQQPTSSNELFGHTYSHSLLHALSELSMEKLRVGDINVWSVVSDGSSHAFSALTQWHTSAGQDAPVVIDEGQEWETSASVDKIVLGHRSIQHFVNLVDR